MKSYFTEKTILSKGKHFFLFFFFLSPFFLRFYSLGKKPLWFDEHTSLSGAVLDLPFWEKLSFSAGDLWGMLYANFLIDFQLPLNPFVLRVPYAFLGGVLVPLASSLLRGRDRYLFPLLLIFAPYVHYFSQESRPYVGNIVAGSYIWLLFYRWIETGTISHFALWGMLFFFFFFALSSPFLLLGVGVPFFYLIYKAKRWPFFFISLILFFLYFLYLLAWLSKMDVFWLRSLGFRFGGITFDSLKNLLSWILVVPDDWTGIGVFFLFLGFPSFQERKKDLFFVFFSTIILFLLSFPIAQHPVALRYFSGFFPATAFLMYRGFCWFVESLLIFLRSGWRDLGLSFLFAGYCCYLFFYFYPFYFSTSIKPTVLTSLSGGFYLQKIPFPSSNRFYVSGVRVSKGEGYASGDHLLYLILPEVVTLPFLYPELRGKEWIFLGGDRKKALYRVGREDGYRKIEEGVRHRGISFKICDEKDLENCFLEGSSGEIYLESFFLLPPTDLPPCFFLGNNPCAMGFFSGWEKSWEGEIKVCVPVEEKKRFGTALYLRFSSLSGEERTKILQFRCYR